VAAKVVPQPCSLFNVTSLHLRLSVVVCARVRVKYCEQFDNSNEILA
jgi:hypothetical protein